MGLIPRIQTIKRQSIGVKTIEKRLLLGAAKLLFVLISRPIWREPRDILMFYKGFVSRA